MRLGICVRVRSGEVRWRFGDRHESHPASVLILPNLSYQSPALYPHSRVSEPQLPSESRACMFVSRHHRLYLYETGGYTTRFTRLPLCRCSAVPRRRLFSPRDVPFLIVSYTCSVAPVAPSRRRVAPDCNLLMGRSCLSHHQTPQTRPSPNRRSVSNPPRSELWRARFVLRSAVSHCALYCCRVIGGALS